MRELEPHRMVFYLMDFAGEFHRYYNRNRVVSDDLDLSRARLCCWRTCQLTIRRGLRLLGVDAPMKMAARDRTPKFDGRRSTQRLIAWRRIAEGKINVTTLVAAR